MSVSDLEARRHQARPNRRVLAIALLLSCALCAGSGPARAQAGAAPVDPARIALADAWMRHVLHEEKSSFERQRWIAAAAFGAAAIGWGVGLGIYQSGRSELTTGTAALGVATLISLGFASAALWIEDPALNAALSGIGGFLEFGMASNALTLATHNGCEGDCLLMLSTDTVAAAASIVSALLIQATYPPLLLSARYREYTRLPANEARVSFALNVLREQEARARTASFMSIVYGFGLAGAYTIAATQAYTTEGRVMLGISAATFVLSGVVTLLWNAWTSSPSELLMAGAAP